MPMAFTSMFSSLCVTITSGPTISAAVLRPRLLTFQCRTGSPGWVFSARTAPPPPSPAEGEAAHDDLVAVDDGRRHAPAVGRPHAELFGERALPERLAVPGERHQHPAPPHRADGAGGR